MVYKLLTVFLFVGFTAFGQNSVHLEPEKKAGTTLKLSSKKDLKSKPHLAHPYDWYFNQKVKEYEERMEADAKKYKKMAKLLKKPQYSDPSYFGHKHKPKKHRPGKRKYCKECGIVH